MRFKNLETLIISIFLLLTIVSFISFAYPIRFAGQNLLNLRVWAYMALIIFLFTDRKVFFSKSMLIIYLYVGIYLFLESIGHYDLQADRDTRYYWLSVEHLPLLVSVALAERFYYLQDKKELRILLLVTVAAIMIASLASIYVTFKYPNSVRGTEAAFYIEDFNIYRAMGLGGYDFFSGLPFILPMFIYWYKNETYNKNTRRIFWAIATLIVFLCIYQGVIVAPILFALVLGFFAILGRKRFKSNIVIILIVAFGLMIVPRSTTGGMFYNAARMVSNTEIKSKLNDIGDAISQGIEISESETSGNAVENRASRIPVTLDLFLHNPIIGVGRLDYSTGANEHLFWFNLFSQFGIVGAFPLIWLFIYNIRRNLRRFNEEFKFYYLVSIIGFIAIGFFKVIGGWIMYLIIFFIVPNMCYLEQDEQNQGLRSNK